MNLFKGFDYIFYRVYHIYMNKWKDNTPGAYATGLVTLLQSLIFVLIPSFIYRLINVTKDHLNKKYLIGIFFMFFIFNYIRYFRILNYDILSHKWKDEEETNKRRNGFFVLLFTIITIGGSLVLATVIFENNN